MIRDDAEALADEYLDVAGDDLRLVLWYEGDDYGTAYVRDEMREMYSSPEFDEKLEQLVVEGISDPPTQDPFRLYGPMDVVVRRFETTLMLHFPLDDFSGFAVTVARDTPVSIDTLADLGADSTHQETTPQ